MAGYKRGVARIQLSNMQIVVKTRDTMFNKFAEELRNVVGTDRAHYLNLEHDNSDEHPTKFISNKIEALWFEEFND